jgi:hypothetical protein
MVVAFLLCANAAHAQASRTWVSGIGNDADPCSRTAPCKTFAGAISKTAPKGEINAIDLGGFGVVTITKSISIEGDGTMAGILAAGTNGIIVNAGTADVVTLRNLVIDGFGTGTNGIHILQAKQVHIENCTIQNFVNRGILVDNSSNSIQVFVRNTVIRNNFLGGTVPAGNSGGILLKPTSTGSVSATLDHVNLDQNVFGLRVENNARATMSDGTASGNTTFGVHAITPGPNAASVILEGVTISNNVTGVQAEGSAFASVRISNTMITSNSVGLSAVTNGQILSSGNNSVVGNGTDGAPTSPATPQI